MRRTPANPYLATSANRPETILGDALSPSIRIASAELLSGISSCPFFPLAWYRPAQSEKAQGAILLGEVGGADIVATEALVARQRQRCGEGLRDIDESRHRDRLDAGRASVVNSEIGRPPRDRILEAGERPE